MAFTHVQYTKIRDRLCQLGGNCALKSLQFLKTTFKEDINSQRVFERIQDISYLFRILEKRDCIGPNHKKNLSIMIREIGPEDEYINRIWYGREVPNLSVFNSGAANRTQENRVIPPVIRDVTDRVNQLIKMQIGIKWKELARGLGISEGIIEQLENKHRYDLSEAIHEVLRNHQETCYNNEERWRVDLQRALDRARRRDLIEEMDEILRS
ncbi:uncharacterized protein LOC126745718 [Anthonomus grandis grandis]|uniref:uncharacterized protein LOC126745718 n=1 Tax=Anthonomus grandis grandis TaxID=2921223 RepID=UPI002166BF90|nr:uncharacterized protein LOC126745718 [Anthonomus grandis grandis]